MVALAISVSVFVVFFLTLLNALPSTTALNPAFLDSLTLVYGYMQMFNWLLPIDTLAQILIIAVTIEVALWVWRMVRWTISVVRGASL